MHDMPWNDSMLDSFVDPLQPHSYITFTGRRKKEETRHGKGIRTLFLLQLKFGTVLYGSSQYNIFHEGERSLDISSSNLHFPPKWVWL